jgi:hypothetical protein
LEARERVTIPTSDSYAVQIERRRPWLVVATVWWLCAGEEDPVELATFRAVTRAGAKRQSARFVAQRQEVAA